MAITLQDKLKTLSKERQELIRSRTDELIRQEYALRQQEERQEKLLKFLHIFIQFHVFSSTF